MHLLLIVLPIFEYLGLFREFQNMRKPIRQQRRLGIVARRLLPYKLFHLIRCKP